MGLPSINIVFQTVADNSIKMSQKGVVGMILQDPRTSWQYCIDCSTRRSASPRRYRCYRNFS